MCGFPVGFGVCFGLPKFPSFSIWFSVLDEYKQVSRFGISNFGSWFLISIEDFTVTVICYLCRDGKFRSRV